MIYYDCYSYSRLNHGIYYKNQSCTKIFIIFIAITTDRMRNKNAPQTNAYIQLGLITNNERESVLLFVPKNIYYY